MLKPRRESGGIESSDSRPGSTKNSNSPHKSNHSYHPKARPERVYSPPRTQPRAFFACQVAWFRYHRPHASFSYNSLTMVRAGRRGGQWFGAISILSTSLTAFLRLTRWFRSLLVRSYPRSRSAAPRPARRAPRWRSHWHCLLSALRRYAVGLHIGSGFSLVVYAFHRNCTSSRGSQSHHHDPRPLQHSGALGAGSRRRAEPCLGGSYMEPPLSRPLALSCCLARPISSLLVLGWMG